MRVSDITKTCYNIFSQTISNANYLGTHMKKNTLLVIAACFSVMSAGSALAQNNAMLRGNVSSMPTPIAPIQAVAPAAVAVAPVAAKSTQTASSTTVKAAPVYAVKVPVVVARTK